MFGWGGYKKLKEDNNEKREDKRRGLRSKNFKELLIFQPIDLDSGKREDPPALAIRSQSSRRQPSWSAF